MKGSFYHKEKIGILQLKVSRNSHTRYFYKAGFFKLLADYYEKAGNVTFSISHSMKNRLIVVDQLKCENHNVVTCPENHSDLHLINVIFYNIGKFLKKKKPVRLYVHIIICGIYTNAVTPSYCLVALWWDDIFTSSLNPTTKAQISYPTVPLNDCFPVRFEMRSMLLLWAPTWRQSALKLKETQRPKTKHHPLN